MYAPFLGVFGALKFYFFMRYYTTKCFCKSGIMVFIILFKLGSLGFEMVILNAQ